MKCTMLNNKINIIPLILDLQLVASSGISPSTSTKKKNYLKKKLEIK